MNFDGSTFQLIRAFEDSPYRARKTIGDHLRRLRYARNEADYGAPSLPLATLQERATKALRLTDVVLADIARLHSPS
jgi:hypothetical protein